jgi:hypothetical protein
MTRKQVGRAGLLDVEFEGGRPARWAYVPAPKPEQQPVAA